MFSVFHATATRSVVATCPFCCYVLPLVTTRFVSTPTTRDCAGALVVVVVVVVVAAVENAGLASEGERCLASRDSLFSGLKPSEPICGPRLPLRLSSRRVSRSEDPRFGPSPQIFPNLAYTPLPRVKTIEASTYRYFRQLMAASRCNAT
ncbi:hypothetical protein CGRA01v4_00580 [Colletotrichum graminicola]|nr:hypothetical protein CGRA01v4_00580 [Colletotrichum graminicola]